MSSTRHVENDFLHSFSLSEQNSVTVNTDISINTSRIGHETIGTSFASGIVGLHAKLETKVEKTDRKKQLEKTLVVKNTLNGASNEKNTFNSSHNRNGFCNF